MAVLLLEDGRRFATPDAINDLIGPTRVDAFPLPTGVDHLLAEPALDEGGRTELLAHRDPALDAEIAAGGWPPPLLQVLWPSMPADVEAQVRGYGPPHVNPADEVHHVVDGAIEFGLVLGDGSQALLTLLPGDALRLHEGTEHWSVLTADRRAKVVVYLSRPPGFAHRFTGTEVRVR